MNSVDERIVDMQFNNKQFEDGIQTSLKSLDNLNKGLSNTNGMNLNALETGIQTVANRFTTLGIIATTTLVNITNSAISAGTQFVKSFTLDPISMGFKEYETQINAVQTILANTANKGTTLQQVNSALAELNTYADKTIYNFTEMTRNIGTFTAAGVELDVSVQAIKGISNLAAVSGSNAQQASSAMYQLSQALSTGTVKLMDWNSVVNAGMGGQVFQDALTETARVHGVAIDQMITSEGSFRETLSKGWLTSDILLETLNKFTGDMSEAQLRQLGYTEEQITEIIKLGNMANSAATEVKTLSQLFDTLSEAAQSGWTKSWEILIGDFGEAKKLLTDISNTMSDIIGTSSDNRNNLLSGGLSTGWKQFLAQGISDEAAYKEAISDVAKLHNKSLDDMIEKEGSFEDVLKTGWLTADIMTESLAHLVSKTEGLSDAQLEEIGYTREQVTTLENLNSSVKDGTVSIDEFADKIAKVSGRENLIQSMWNAFEGLLSVVKPINDAFREIFPPLTGDQLYAFTEGILKLSEKFKIGDDTANNLKRTFAGLFAIVDIGKQLLTAMAKSVTTLASAILPCTGGLLSFTGLIGDFIVGIDNAIKTSDVFNRTFSAITNVIINVVKAIQNDLKGMFATPAFQTLQGLLTDTAIIVEKAFNSIMGTFSNFKNIDLSGVDEFNNNILNSFRPFTMLGNILSGSLSVIQNILETLAPVFIKLGSIFGSAFASLTTSITSTFSSDGIMGVLDIINGGLFAAILLGIKGFINSLTDITSNAGGFLDNITGILEGVRGSLEAYQSSLKAKTLITIAGAIAILAGALVVLSMIDSEKLTNALGAISVLFIELSASMMILQKNMGPSGMVKISIAMISMATAILILSSAMSNLAVLDWNGIAKGTIGIGVLMFELQKFVNTIKPQKLLSTSIAMIAIGAALKILADAVAILGALDLASLVKGLGAVGVILAELTLFINTIQPQKLLSTSISMIAIGTAMKILASAVKDLGIMDITTIAKGLTALGVVLAEIGIFANLVRPEKLLSTSIAMVAIGTSMLIFAEVIGKMGVMSMAEISKGLVAMGGSLAILGVAISTMPTGMGAKAISLLVLSSALVVLSEAMTTMGGMSWSEVAKSLITLAGSLTIITIAMQAMTGGLAGAAAMLVMATAIMVLTPALKILGSMSITEIGISLLALVGVFAIVGASAIILGPVIPVILALSAAIALLGVGVLAVGAGLLAFSAGLTALAVSGTAGAAALVLIITSITSIIPLIAEQLGRGIIAFARVISEGTPAIMIAFKAIVEGLLLLFGELMPKLMDTLFKFIDEMLSKLVEYTPKFMESGTKILKSFIAGIAENIGDIIEIAVAIMLNFIKGVSNKIPEIIQTAISVVVSFIDAIGKETPRLVDAGFKMIIDFINGLSEAIIGRTPELVDAITNLAGAIIIGLTTGLLKGISNVITTIKKVGTALINGFKEILGIHSPSTIFINLAGDIINGLINGINNRIGAVIKSAKEIGSAVIDNVRLKFKEIDAVASNIISGLSNGLTSGTNKVTDAAKRMASSALNAAKKELDIHSPSRRFEKEVGENVALGMAAGMENRTDAVAKSAKQMSKTAYDNAVLWIKNYRNATDYLVSEELEMWNILASKYQYVSKEKIEIDKNVLELQKKLAEEKAALDKASFEHSKKWIEDKKAFEELSLLEEVQAWERVQARYAEGTELRKEADKNLFDAKKRLLAEEEQLLNDREAAEQRYTEAVDNRTQAIVGSFGLFEELKEKEKVSSETLRQNLQDQVDEMRNWADNLAILAKRGIDEGLLGELQQMGPDANNEISALVRMTDTQLTDYQLLWKEKSEIARQQAIGELKGLRQEVNDEVANINKELSKLGYMDSGNFTELGKQSIDALVSGYKEQEPDVIAAITKISENVNSELTSNIPLYNKTAGGLMQSVAQGFTDKKQDVVNSSLNVSSSASDSMNNNTSSFYNAGVNAISGFIEGMRAKIQEVAYTAALIAREAYDSAKTELDIHSPSRKFKNIGIYSAEGLIAGLKNMMGAVGNVASEMGNSAVNSLGEAMNNIAYMFQDDMEFVPTITPVIDLSNIQTGMSKIDNLLSANKTLNLDLSGVRATAKSSNTASENMNNINQTNTSTTPSIINNFNCTGMTVRTDTDIDAIATKLYQKQQMAMRGKGR